MTPHDTAESSTIDPVIETEAIRGILAFHLTADEVEYTVHNIGETAKEYVMTERTDAFRFGEKRRTLGAC